VAARGTGTIRSRSPERSYPLPSTTTRGMYRLLLLRGLTPDEAANLTAFLVGIPVAQRQWTLGEVNRLLFVRELWRSGRYGRLDERVH
jgi:hypothetical protein